MVFDPTFSGFSGKFVVVLMSTGFTELERIVTIRRRDACTTLRSFEPIVCDFMVLCPFGGFFLPSVHCGSVLGFRPYGFLAGPHWFHFA
jgi:hypothetical protein